MKTVFGWLVAAGAALVSTLASAAWYDTPGTVKLVPLSTASAKTEDPHFMNKSANDKTLLVNMNASNDNDGPYLIDMDELVDPENDAPTMRKVFAKPSSIGANQFKGGAISSDLGLAILGNGSTMDSCAFLTGAGTAWTKGINLFNRTLDCKMDALDFGTGSTYLYGNLYPNGGIARYTVGEKGVLSDKVTKATTVARVRNLSVHQVNGTELVYYGEGNAANGKICVLDVTAADTASWTETDLGVSLAGQITNVKLSNEDTATPILYALTDNGYLGIYKLAADGKSVVETIKTIEPAELKVLAGTKSADAKFRNFEVTKDGNTAFLINRVDEHNVYLAVLASVPYIEMTAADRLGIDTLYTPGPETAIWADYAFMGNNPTEQYFIYEAGGANSNGNAYFRPYINGNTGTAAGTRAYAWALNASGWISTGTVVTPGERHQLLLDSYNNQVKFWTGSTVKTVTPAGARPTMRTTSTLKLFCSSGMASNFADMRVYGIKVYEKGELVRNFVPAKKGEVVGVYETVEGLFYTNNKTANAFTAVGPVMEIAADSEDDANNYIESNGSVAYSTDYYANPKTTWRIDYQPPTVDDCKGKVICGAYGDNAAMSTILYSSGSWIYTCFNDGSYKSVTFDTAADAARRQVLVDGLSRKATMYKEGLYATQKNLPNDATVTSKYPFMLFGNGNGYYGQISQQAKVRIFSAQIWDEGKLVRDYRPLVLDGKPGLLDRVTGQFMCGPGLTAGSGVPTASGIGEGCIEADGTTAVNADFWPTDKSRIEVDYAFNDVGTTQKRVYGNDGMGKARRCSVYINGNGQLAFGYGDGVWKGGYTVASGVNIQRHTTIQDFKNRTFRLTTGSVTNSWVGTIDATDFATNFVKSAAAPISLFGGSNHAKGWTANNTSKMRIYRARFYEDDVLVRDFVPAKRDGKAGFKDLVTGRFHGANMGTGLAAIGTVIEEESEKPADNCYVEGKGGSFNYITIPHFPSGATRYECDFALTQINSGKILFGSYDCGFSQILYLTDNNYTFDSGNGKHTDAKLPTKLAQDTKRHTAIIDAPAAVYSVLAPDGTVEMSDSSSAKTRTETATKPTILFGTSHSNAAGGNGAQCAIAKIFAFRIYEAGILVHDYVPRKVDGIVGFKDLATGEFVTGEGLVAGAGVPTEKGDAYIDSVNRTKHAFDTGYIATPDTCVEIDFAYMSHDNNSQQFALAGDDDIVLRTYTSGSKTNDACMAWAFADKSLGSAIFLNDGTHVQVGVRRQIRLDGFNKRVKITTGSQGGYVNTDKALSNAITGRNTQTIKIFSNSLANGNYAMARLYGLKIYEEGELVRNYVPHLVGDEPTLRDTVSGQVLPQMASVSALASGGEFDSTEIESQDGEDAYVDTDGANPLVLGYFTKATSKIVVDFASRKVASNAMLISPWDNGCGKASALWINTVGKFRFIVGNTRTAELEGNLANGRRHTAIIDAPNTLVELLENGTKSVLRDDDTASFSGADALWPLTLGGSVKNAAGTTFEAKFSTPIRVYGVKIYENEVLVHDFVPTIENGVAGLLDVKGNLGFRTAAGLTAGGAPIVGPQTGEVTVYKVRPEDGKISYHVTDATLRAEVVNAAYYRWTMNGVELAGVTSGILPISWQRHSGAKTPEERSDTYTVTPIFLVDGEEVEGETATAVISSNLAGISIIIR